MHPFARSETQTPNYSHGGLRALLGGSRALTTSIVTALLKPPKSSKYIILKHITVVISTHEPPSIPANGVYVLSPTYSFPFKLLLVGSLFFFYGSYRKP